MQLERMQRRAILIFYQKKNSVNPLPPLVLEEPCIHHFEKLECGFPIHNHLYRQSVPIYAFSPRPFPLCGYYDARYCPKKTDTPLEVSLLLCLRRQICNKNNINKCKPCLVCTPVTVSNAFSGPTSKRLKGCKAMLRIKNITKP